MLTRFVLPMLVLLAGLIVGLGLVWPQGQAISLSGETEKPKTALSAPDPAASGRRGGMGPR